MWEAIAGEVAVVGLVNLGALIYLLGGMRSDIAGVTERVDKLESQQGPLVADVAEIKGRCDVMVCRADK